MTLLMLQYPLLPLLAAVSAVLSVLAVHRKNAWLTLGVILCTAAVLVAGLACMLPYRELLLLVLPSLLACFAAVVREERV